MRSRLTAKSRMFLTLICVFPGTSSLGYHNLSQDQLNQLQDALDQRKGN